MGFHLTRRGLPIAFATATALMITVLAGPALAGGSWFYPVKDRYEPGDEATLVGYTGGGAYGWIEDGPFFGYLVESSDGGPLADGERLPLGEIQLEETGDLGYLKLRASISFTVPADLEPGIYWFGYCNADCTEQLGDLIGGLVPIGVDPEHPISREWPADDPEIANLHDTAQISGPGFEVAAEELRNPTVEADESSSTPQATAALGGLAVLAIGAVWVRRNRVGKPARA